MDVDNKMKKWLDLAKQFQDGQFWDSVFDSGYTEKIMEQVAKTSSNKSAEPSYPPVDILKNNHDLIIVLDLPGVLKEDIDISLTDDGLNVKGVANRGYSAMTKVQSERYSGTFERTIALPEMVISRANITAKFENGIVEIRIPRTNRTSEKIKID